MVHLDPDYPEPTTIDEEESTPQQRKCSGTLWLQLVFTMVVACLLITCGISSVIHNRDKETIAPEGPTPKGPAPKGPAVGPHEAAPGGGYFGPWADNQITVTNGAGSITVGHSQKQGPAPISWDAYRGRTGLGTVKLGTPARVPTQLTPTNDQILIKNNNGGYIWSLPQDITEFRLPDPVYADTRKSGYDKLHVTPTPPPRNRFREECHPDMLMFDNKGHVICK